MQYKELRYVPESEDPSLTIETADLMAKVIDNTGLLAPPTESKAYFNARHMLTPYTHHLGYHGVRTFCNRKEKRNLVIPYASWLNLQTAELTGIKPDLIDERAWSGHGRGWPIRLEKAGHGARLRLEPLPNMKIGYSLELQPAEPDGIDFSVNFEFGRQPVSGTSRFRAAWPLYINAYDDVRLFYPKGESAGNWRWSSVGKKPDIILGEPVGFQIEFRRWFTEKQALPLGYGRIGKNVLIIMFSDPKVHLFVVDTGGHFSCSPVQNPAWDFEWIAENYPSHRPMGFSGRLIYTRFQSKEQILRRYKEWNR
jgi:hypothetical protein